ncbi:MAG: DUF3494 domain-containing protein [Sandaracinaceae bacterium]|nr:DUF3494 domain-containing protein [Sandaracinaceae bacterium]
MANAPTTGALDVPVNAFVSATFSEPMNRDTLDELSFTVTGGDPVMTVEGTVIYSRSVAVFWPAARLAINTDFTATITTSATSERGVPLAENHVWGFRTGETVAPGLPVNLGTAGDFVVLSKSGISSDPASTITGNIGVSPAAGTAITGFSLMRDATGTFATSTQVTGQVFAANYTAPTPDRMTAAIGDMELAFTDAAGRAPDYTELGSGHIGGMTLAAGVYKWGTAVLIETDMHLSGSATDVWIFQIAQDRTMSSDVEVFLDGGALPENVFWQVSGLVEVGTTAHLEGIVVSQTSITFRTGASLRGRILAQTAVVLQANTLTQPAN